MWNSFTQILAKILILPTIFLMSHAGYATPTQQQLSPVLAQAESQYLQASQQYGATYPFAGQTYNLAGAGISSSASTIVLASLTIKQTGQQIQSADLVGTTGGIFYVTIEPGSNSKQEIVGCTAVIQNGSSASLTGCTRGLSPIYPYTASTTLQFTHGGGSSVIFSDPPQLFQQFYALANPATSTNTLVFSSTTPPHYDSPGAQATGSYISTTSELVSWAGLLAVSQAGAVNAQTATKGIVQLSTGAQAAAHTSLGSTGASLALASSMASSSCPTAANNVIITRLSDGHIDPSCVATSTSDTYNFAGNMAFNGGATSTATTTLAASSTTANPLKINTVPYAFQSTQGASSTALTDDGTGNLKWILPQVTVATTTGSVYTISGTAASTTAAYYIIPAGTLITASRLKINAIVSQTVNQAYFEVDLGNGTATSSLMLVNNAGSSSGMSGTMFVNSSTLESFEGYTSTGAVITATSTVSLGANTASTLYISFIYRASNSGSGTASYNGMSIDLFRN